MTTRGPRRPTVAARTTEPLDALVSLIEDGASPRRLARRLAAGGRHVRPAVERLADASIRMARADLVKADRLARAAALVAARGDDAHARGRGARAVGHVLALQGDWTAALAHYERAIADFAIAGSVLDEGITRSGALQTLIYLARYDQAREWAERARVIFAASGDTLRLARLDSNLGNVLHRQARFEQAMAHYERALATFSERGDDADAAITLRNMAVCQIALQRFDDAHATYQAARGWCLTPALARLLPEVDYNFAYLHYLRGEYATAIDLYARARTQALAHADPLHAALCDLDESELYVEINLIPEGEALAAQAAQQFDRLGLQHEASKARATLALVAGRDGRLATALALFDEVRARFAEEGNALWPAQIDLLKAALLESAAPAESYALCRAARRHFAASPLTARTAACDVLLARLALSGGDLGGAADAVGRALEALTDVDSPALACRVHATHGDVLEHRGEPDAALAAYRQAHAAIEGLRRHLDHDELKVAFLEDKRAVFEGLVALMAARPGPVDMAAIFELVEQSKSRVLAEQMALLGAASMMGSATGPNAEVRAAAGRLHAVSRQLREEAARDRPDPSRLTSLGRDRAVLRGRLRELTSALDNDEPDITAGATVALRDVQEALPAGTLIVECHEVRGVLQALVIVRDQARLVVLGPMDPWRRRLRLLRFQLGMVADGSGRRPLRDAPSPALTDHLTWFSQQLLPPLAEYLAGATRVVIVPHDVLHALPFHALHLEGRMLLDSHVVSYAPSVSVNFHAGKRPPCDGGHSVVLGVPDRLAPAIGTEAAALADLLPNVRLAVGPDATRACLETHAPGARYIHIATHGRFRQDNPLFSSIRLADGDMRVLDLAGLRLSADLVSLSGCGTGLSVPVGGDELLGLTRALLAAGARAVLVSLWDVHDETAAALMAEVYRRIVAGEGAADALRAAMIAARMAAPDPFYWAPFVVSGHPISSDADQPL